MHTSPVSLVNGLIISEASLKTRERNDLQRRRPVALQEDRRRPAPAPAPRPAPALVLPAPAALLLCVGREARAARVQARDGRALLLPKHRRAPEVPEVPRRRRD
eukprot:2647377-Rhodomonas_salina.3